STVRLPNWSSYVCYSNLSAGASNRSTAFNVQPPPATPRIDNYSWTPNPPVAGQNFGGTVSGANFVANGTEVWFCSTGTSNCFLQIGRASCRDNVCSPTVS